MLKTRWMCKCGCAGIYFNIILYDCVDLVQFGNCVVLLRPDCVGCAGSGPTQLQSHNGRLISAYIHSASLIKLLKDVLRRNFSKTELPEDGISRYRNASKWKLACDLLYTA